MDDGNKDDAPTCQSPIGRSNAAARVLDEMTQRAMLLCDVAPGKKFRTENAYEGETQWGMPTAELTGIQHDHDSVHGCASGKLREHNTLNYDELVVYDENQALPRFAVVYRVEGCKRQVSGWRERASPRGCWRVEAAEAYYARLVRHPLTSLTQR